MLELASAVGLATPRTEVASTPAELAQAVKKIGLPCVVKPHRSVVGDGGSMRRLTVTHVDTEAAAASLAAEYPKSAYPLLVQERIAGPGEGLFLLVDAGIVYCAFAHRRIREYPVSGGASTYRESIELPTGLAEQCARLLVSVGWSGVAMVEFKRSAADGRAYLMEVNGRLWGSLKLALDSGVDFPVMLARLAGGESIEPVVSYKTGNRCRWFWGDVDHLLDRLRHSRETLNLPANAPSRLSAVLSFLAIHPFRDHCEVFSFADARPWLFETRDWIAKTGRRFRGKIGVK